MNTIFKNDFNMFFDIFRDGFILTTNFYLTGGVYEQLQFFYLFKLPTIFFSCFVEEKYKNETKIWTPGPSLPYCSRFGRVLAGAFFPSK